MPLLGRKRATPAAPRSLVSSGQVVDRARSDSLRRVQQPWQQRSLTYYHQLGAVKYAAQFYMRMLHPLRLYAAKLNEKNEPEEIEQETATGDDLLAREALERIRDPNGGRQSLQSNYGRLMFLTGEALMTVTHDQETSTEMWEMLSISELKPEGEQYSRQRAPGEQPEIYRRADPGKPAGERDAVVYRLWRPDPEYSDLADATMQGVLDDCEELLLLTNAIRARALSRAAGAGILILDDRIMVPPLENAPDENPNVDPAFRSIIEAMTAPISDPGAPSAVVPLMMRVRVPENTKAADLAAHIQLVDPTQLYPETGLRKETIERMALGLDMPAEVLLGVAQANHWTGWLVDEQSWKAHGQPLAQQMVNDWTAAYYQPELKARSVTDWDRYVIHFDPADVINHPDRTKDAKDLHDRGVIGDPALRDAAGFVDDDAQTEDERQTWLAIKLRDSTLVGGAGSTPPPGVTPTGDGEDPGAVQPGPPPAGPPQNGSQPVEPAVVGNGYAPEAWRLIGAANLALYRARELAGSRLRNYAKRDPDVLRLIDGARARDVAPILRDHVGRLKCPPAAELVAGTEDLIRDACHLHGIRDAKAVDRIVRTVQRHAARTLFDETPAPLPSTFDAYVTAKVERG